MIATIIFVLIIILFYILDTFVFVPKGTKLFSKKHFIDGDKTGYITKVFTLNYKKIVKGQIWRLFTQVFLHVGIAHITFNSIALLIVGTALSLSIGWKMMLFGFFFSAFFSAIIICFGLNGRTDRVHLQEFTD